MISNFIKKRVNRYLLNEEEQAEAKEQKKVRKKRMDGAKFWGKHGGGYEEFKKYFSDNFNYDVLLDAAYNIKDKPKKGTEGYAAYLFVLRAAREYDDILKAFYKYLEEIKLSDLDMEDKKYLQKLKIGALQHLKVIFYIEETMYEMFKRRLGTRLPKKENKDLIDNVKGEEIYKFLVGF